MQIIELNQFKKKKVLKGRLFFSSHPARYMMKDKDGLRDGTTRPRGGRGGSPSLIFVGLDALTVRNVLCPPSLETSRWQEKCSLCRRILSLKLVCYVTWVLWHTQVGGGVINATQAHTGKQRMLLILILHCNAVSKKVQKSKGKKEKKKKTPDPPFLLPRAFCLQISTFWLLFHTHVEKSRSRSWAG